MPISTDSRVRISGRTLGRHLAQQDRGLAHTQHSSGRDIVHFRLQHRLSANDAGKAGPVDDGDGDDDRGQPRAQHRRQHDRQQHRRESHPDIHKAGYRLIGGALEKAGSQAEQRAQHAGKAGRDNGNNNSDPCAEDEALALALNERRAAEPMLPVKLWRNRVVAVGCLAGFFNGALMMGVSGFLPTYVQGAMGRGATAAGVVLAASSVSWAFASMAAGRLMIRTSYRLSASIGGLCLVAGSLVLILLTPASGLFWAGSGAFILGIGMGFCNTAFIVSTQASVGWNDRGMATSSTMFMRIVGQSVGAAVFGAILNFGVYRLLPNAGDAVNRLMSPAARQTLGAHEIARLTEAVGSSLHVVYISQGSSRWSAWSWPCLCPRGSARPARTFGGPDGRRRVRSRPQRRGRLSIRFE